MDQLNTMATWVQSYIDALDTGTVTVGQKDYIPGNCALVYLGTRELSRQEDLQGNLLRRCRSKFRLYRFTGNIHTVWWDQLDQWMIRATVEGNVPDFGQVDGVVFSMEALQCSALLPEGIYEQTALLQLDYTTYHEREVSQ